MAIAVVGFATVVIALVITWLLWPREEAVVSSAMTVHAAEPIAVNGFDVCRPGWAAGSRGTIAFSGHLVVWSVADESGSRLMAADVRLHTPFRLLRAEKGASVREPVLDGPLLVWRKHRSTDPARKASLWVMDVNERRATRISGPAVIGEVDVAQGRVAWLERTATGRVPTDVVRVFDVASGRRWDVPAGQGLKTDVAVDEGVLAWSAAAGGPSRTGIWLYDLLGKKGRRLTKTGVRGIDISGSYVVWAASDGSVRGYNLASGRRQELSEGGGAARDCRVDGSLAVWWDVSAIGGVALVRAGDVFGADLRSGHRFPISMHGSAHPDPEVWGTTVVWPDDSLGHWVLRGAQVSL